MYGGATLPVTGAGIVLFGVSFGLSWVLGVAITMIMGGALLWRLGTRRRRHVS